MGYLKNKPGSVEEAVRNLSKHTEDSEYQKMFKKELEKTGKGLASMSDVEKKNFFNMIHVHVAIKVTHIFCYFDSLALEWKQFFHERIVIKSLIICNE